MKKVLALISIIILFGCASAQSQLTHSWDEVDQAVTDVQNAQPLPAGKLVPDGGTTGQVLQKNSDTDGDTGWGDPASGTGNLKSDGSVPMDSGYVPSNAQDIATKDYADSIGGGGGIQKWNMPLYINDAAGAAPFIPWVRPFDDWKIGSITGKVDVGTADVDLVACDVDGANCVSFLSGVFTLTTTEQAIPLDFDGIMADTRLEVALSNISSATEVWLDSHGTYETGTPPITSTELLHLDFETVPTWDNTLGTEDCALDTENTYCNQSTDYPHGGTHSFGILGVYNEVYVEKNFTPAGEYTLDFWQHIAGGYQGYRIGIYDASHNFLMSMELTSGTTLRIYYDDSAYLDTLIDVSGDANTTQHYRVYYNKTDGTISVWKSPTVDNFDGVTPDFTQSGVALQPEDASILRIPGYLPTGGNSYITYTDDVYIWEGARP